MVLCVIQELDGRAINQLLLVKLECRLGSQVRDPSREAAGHVQNMSGSDQLAYRSLVTRR